jgi:uncharacterized protein (DUF2141 family)
MKIKILLTIAFVFWILSFGFSQNIKVKIQNIKLHYGTVYVALCNSAENFMTEKYKELTAKVSPSGEASVDFMKIPKGVYAIRVYHDTDLSGDLTTNLIGTPEEPFGFSNNPQIKMGPPSFELASFGLKKTDINLTINLLSVE